MNQIIMELRARANARHSGPEQSPTAQLCAQAAERIADLEAALASILAVAPRLPKVHQWTGVAAAEDLFDLGLRHKSGLKPYDYLKAWLNMLRPFAYATRDDSWGEMEKLLCIVMRNYVRTAAAADQARPLIPEPAE